MWTIGFSGMSMVQVFFAAAAVGLQTPLPAEESGGGQGSPLLAVLGILALVGGLAWITWQKSRSRDLQKIKTVACLPLIDERAEERVKEKIEEFEKRKQAEERQRANRYGRKHP